MNQNIRFPVYRKYKNNQSFFKVLSDTEFEEIKLIGDKGSLYTFEAKILPDRNFIHDMLHDYKNYWEESDESEFNKIKAEFTKS